ncbi:hypothetical protein C8Q76DRAFT_617365, partial [Earliella scabrosa]
QRVIDTARRGLLYHVDGTRPRLLLVPSRAEWDSACGAPPSVEDLDVDRWFRLGHAVIDINYIPGTDCRLKNGYYLVVAQDAPGRSDHLCENQTVSSFCAESWQGNILLFKRGCRDTSSVVSITPPEVALLSAILQRCV